MSDDADERAARLVQTDDGYARGTEEAAALMAKSIHGRSEPCAEYCGCYSCEIRALVKP